MSFHLPIYTSRLNLWLCMPLLIAFTPVNAETWISSSEGISVLGEKKPRHEWLLSKKEKVSCFKTQITKKNELLSAWGSGRRFLNRGDKQVAAINLTQVGKASTSKHLFLEDGSRIRDFVLDGDNIVAVGHNNGDIHLYSLKSGKHSSFQYSPYADSIAHSVRKGDADHDGKTEYYISITSTNVSGGLGQQGQVIKLDVNWNKLTAKKTIVLDAYENYDSYVKELAVIDINGDGKQELIMEIAPQIEVYGRNNIDYTEPMRFVITEYKNNQYHFTTIAEARLRLGRILSFADIDKDGLNEIFFIDYYKTGIYVMEPKHDSVRAEGKNINSLNNNWSLTRITARSNENKDLPTATQLKGNHVIFLPEKNQLIASNDSAKDLPSPSGNHIPATPMSVHQYDIILGKNSYYLKPGKVTRIAEVGEIWHLNSRFNRKLSQKSN